MIVDDQEDMRLIVAMIVESVDNWQVVVEAGDGQEAIEKISDHLPDLVLLDASMPVLDGLEALPELRRRVPDSRIIMLSAFPADAMRQRALDRGADGYIEKDNLVTNLVQGIEEILAAPRQPVHG